MKMLESGILRRLARIPPGCQLQIISILIGSVAILVTFYSVTSSRWIEFQINPTGDALLQQYPNDETPDHISDDDSYNHHSNDDSYNHHSDDDSYNHHSDDEPYNRVSKKDTNSTDTDQNHRWLATFKLPDPEISNRKSSPRHNPVYFTNTYPDFMLVSQKVFSGLWSVCISKKMVSRKRGADAMLTRAASADGEASTEDAAAAAALAQRCYGCDDVHRFDDSEAIEKLQSSANSRTLRASHVATSIAQTVCQGVFRVRITSVAGSILLFGGVILCIFGLRCRSFLLIVAAFTFTLAGLCQLLAIFLFAMMVNDVFESTNSTDIQERLRYRYGSGFVCAVAIFLGTNMAAITATQSYKRWMSTREKAVCEFLVLDDSMKSRREVEAHSNLYV